MSTYRHIDPWQYCTLAHMIGEPGDCTGGDVVFCSLIQPLSLWVKHLESKVKESGSTSVSRADERWIKNRSHSLRPLSCVCVSHSNRPPREGGALLRLRSVPGPLPHALRPGGPDLLPHRLPAPTAAARQEATAARQLVVRLQRLRLWLGHQLGPVGAPPPPLRAHAQHECVHIGRGAGAGAAAGGAGADHTGDLDERAARHPGDAEPQQILLIAAAPDQQGRTDQRWLAWGESASCLPLVALPAPQYSTWE